MKNVKKLLALVLVGVFAVGMLAACGGNTQQGGGNEGGSGSVAPAGSGSSAAAPAAPSGKKFVIATDMGFYPFEFEEADGTISGIDMDLIRAIAEDQGFEIDIHYVGWDAAIAECQAGQADGMIAGASITDERKNSGWIFSDGYYVATQIMAVKADSDIQSLDDLKGKSVAVKNTTMSDKYATGIADKYGFEVVRLETTPDLYQQVEAGQVAACFDDTPVVQYNINAGKFNGKTIASTENSPADYGFVIFNADKQELIDLFNAGLANLKKNGKYDEILEKYLGKQ